MKLNRRQFVSVLAASSVPWVLTTSKSQLWSAEVKRSTGSAMDRLNIGVIGTANRAGDNLKAVAHENIVALCDVDQTFLNQAAQQHRKAELYRDFRRLLDRRDLDAVVIGTPDHTHAVITSAALRKGLPVYCEKPLTRTLSECRAIIDLAKKSGVPTQMGTQIHAGANYRRVVELIQTGAIGVVSDVHVWVGGGFGGDSLNAIPDPVPAQLDYDLWLGPLPSTPYHKSFHPFSWRPWWQFAGGTLADLGCHHLDLSHWALALSHPASVRASGPPVHAQSTPPWMIVEYQYPARLARPPVKLTWYHGGKLPPHFAEGILPKWSDGTLFVGSKGMLLANYGSYRLLPEKDFAGFQKPAPFIPDSKGHHQEWIDACKGRGKTTCPFEYSGVLTESVLLGNLAYRSGQEIHWNVKKNRVMEKQAFEEFGQHRYRKGWKV